MAVVTLRRPLAREFSSELAINPNCGGVEDRLKLHAHGALPPTRGCIPCRQIKGPPIPGNSAIVDQWSLHLPAVRHCNCPPTFTGNIYAIPIVLRTPIAGVSTK